MPVTGPMSFDECMSRDWTGISDKPAFCATMERGEINKAWGLKIHVSKAQATSDDEATVTGWASVVTDEHGVPIIDYDGDIIPVRELEKAAQTAFVDAGGKGRAGDMHERTGVADIVESMVLTKEKRQALGLGEGPEGWVVTLKVRDKQLVKDIRSGRKLELSLHGEALSIPVEG